MNMSILQILVELTERIVNRTEKGEIFDLDTMAAEVNSDCKEAATNIIQVIINEINQRLRRDKDYRKEIGLVIKEKDRPRELLTELGTIRFDRDYFYDKESECYTTPLDRILGIDKYERVGGTVGAALVSAAPNLSYSKAASAVTGGAVTRQTVRHKILKAEIPEHEPVAFDREIKELHIFADEDHVHMQKPGKEKGKKSKIVPLVTVTEGMYKESKGRNRTLNPMHFSDEKFDTKNLWKSVEGYIETAYNTEKIEKIYIHGDGGKWIKNGLEIFSQSMNVMDGYHFFKALRGIHTILPKRNIRITVINALKGNNRRKADRYIQDLLSERLTEKEKEKIVKFATYLFSNWEEIRRRICEEIPGSCTEGLISHVLSERFSRNPLGWSEKALGKLVAARLYIKNGGKLNKDVFVKECGEKETYQEYADRYIEEYIKCTFDFSLFEPEKALFDTASGT